VVVVIAVGVAIAVLFPGQETNNIVGPPENCAVVRNRSTLAIAIALNTNIAVSVVIPKIKCILLVDVAVDAAIEGQRSTNNHQATAYDGNQAQSQLWGIHCR